VVLVASQGGLPTHPMWFLNLCANPEVHVQIRAQTHTMRARVADDAERAQLWPRLIRTTRGGRDTNPGPTA
jgi:F420H(2)-dependent quinone reductase